ncbi:DNA repair helicase [Thermoplasma volcanium GSS1]|uniref:DNA 5'-3' helicase n=1 Tax=Thermoplasma volcanium (strain ATCC 51530 / DSM 4299 / JCM 9571 / NBRC 15438 / GSS1) TaxID=273116 RepID=Q97CT8_THEVO|nr:ATP-dependent DNA helicase [Thermoplasma volcanium]BAB59155.1 DNA repair helicase [Thermoplasma volcanium GSS1]
MLINSEIISLSGSMYEDRSYQNEAIDFIASKLANYPGVALEAPTGSGKTMMALLGSLKYAYNGHLKILYLVRTNSQEEQVIRELRTISKNRKIRALPMQGRINLCILYKTADDLKEATAESLSKFCNSRKRQVMEGHQEACPYYTIKVRSKETKDFLFENLPTAEEFYEYAFTNNLCPYESIKASLSDADIVVAPYMYFLNKTVADRFLSHWGVSREQLIIVLDEAHNLPDIGRSLGSFRISIESLNRSEKEAQSFGDPELDRGVHVTDFIEMIRSTLERTIKERVKEDDVRIRFQEFKEYLMIMNKKSEKSIRDLNNYLYLFGEYVENEKEKAGKVPVSYCSSLAQRLEAMMDEDDAMYAAILSKSESGYIQASCLDPSSILSSLKESKTIHMSGTLEPFEFYSDVTGFDIPFRRIENVFPIENRFVSYYEGVSTKYDTLDENEIRKLASIIENIVNGVKRNTIVYFPSYAVMDKVIGSGLDFDFLQEKKNLDQTEFYDVVKKFRNGGKPLLAVSGGRLSEGMNFPGRELELILIAGIPFPRPDATNRALYDYYEMKYKKGWEYAVLAPAIIKIRQEIGRLIRGKDDHGACVILDKRAKQFRRFIPDLVKTDDPVNDINTFFSNFK